MMMMMLIDHPDLVFVRLFILLLLLLLIIKMKSVRTRCSSERERSEIVMLKNTFVLLGS